MKGLELAAMSTDDLWSLRTEVVQLLQQKIKAEQQSLEMRLRMLSGKLFKERFSVRRPYPPVLPKYRNPRGTASCLIMRMRSVIPLGPAMLQSDRPS